MAFDSLQPIGDRRADIRTALLLSQQANLYRDKTKRTTPYNAQEFMPFDQREKEVRAVVKPAGERALISMQTVTFLAAMAAENGQAVSTLFEDSQANG